MPPREAAAVVYDSFFPTTMGGGERVYRRIAELFTARGLRADYLTQSVPAADFAGAPFRVVSIWRGELYRPDGVRRTGAAVGFAARVFVSLLRRRGEYRVVLVSTLPGLTALAARIALLGSGTRVVADWLEVWPRRKWRDYAGAVSGTLGWLVQWLVVRLVREHTVNSRFTASRLAALRPGAAISVLGLLDLVEPADPVSAADPPTALFVGRLIADKDPVSAVRAIAAARSRLPDLRGVVVGSGPEQAAVEEAASATEGIEIAGRLPEEELAPLRRRAAVLVAPSVREGFGLAVAEAAACGVPIVVVGHPDNASVDLVEPGVNGFVVPPGDPAALADAIVEAVAAGDLLRRSAREWFDRSRSERNLSASVDAMLAGTDERR